MTTAESPPIDRVIWVGTGRRGHFRRESDRAWRERLAQEMNDACDAMASQGLRLVGIVPVQSSAPFQGGWTDGAWLQFASAQ